MSKLIIPLKELEYKDLPQVGGKAAILGVLNMQGFPVPDALIITGELYRAFIQEHPAFLEITGRLKKSDMEQTREHLGELIEFFRNVELPEGFVRLLINRLNLLHFPHFSSLAVRPSPVLYHAPTETLSGIHHSVMNVATLRELMDAIKIVWASMWSLKAYEFRRDNFIPHEHVSMALILQKMAQMDYSGVAHSRDPEDPECVRIRVAWGVPGGVTEKKVPSDTVVLRAFKAGEGYSFTVKEEITATKDRMQVYQGQKKIIIDTPGERKDKTILDSYEQEQIATFSRKVEEIFGKPQILVWGREKDLVLLGVKQAEPGKASSTTWTLLPNCEMEGPTPSPFSLSIQKDILTVLTQEFINDCGEGKSRFPAPVKIFLGHTYANLDTYVRLFRKIKIPDVYTVRALQGGAFYTESDSSDAATAMQTGLLDTVKIRSWFDRREDLALKQIQDLESQLAKMTKLHFADLDKKILADSIMAVMKEFLKVEDRYSLLSSVLLSLAMLRKIQPDLKAQEAYRQIPTLTGTIEARYLIDFLEALKDAGNTPEIVGYFRKYRYSPEENFAQLQDTPFYRNMAKFCRDYEFISTYPLEISTERIMENPRILLQMVASLLENDSCLEKIKSTLGRIPILETEVKERKTGGLLNRFIPSGFSREDIQQVMARNILLARRFFKANLQLITIMRKILIEMGRRLHEANMLQEYRDIFYLEIEEILKTASVKYTDYKKLVPERQENHRVYEHLATPRVFSVSGLLVTTLEASGGRFTAPLKGAPINTGTVTGKVKKINNPEDLFNLELGDIVVARELNFVLAPLLLRASGLIIERLNPFLADFMVARIIDIPTVGGVPGFKNSVRDGEVIEFDGDKGIISPANGQRSR